MFFDVYFHEEDYMFYDESGLVRYKAIAHYRGWDVIDTERSPVLSLKIFYSPLAPAVQLLRNS